MKLFSLLIVTVVSCNRTIMWMHFRHVSPPPTTVEPILCDRCCSIRSKFFHKPPHETHKPPHEPPHEPHQPPHKPHKPPHKPHQPPHQPHTPYEPPHTPHEPHKPPHKPHQHFLVLDFLPTFQQ